jgi:hypothetical protein
MAHNSAASVIANALDDMPGELRLAIIKEFQSGIQKDWVKAGIDQTRIAKDSQRDTRSVDGIGRLRMRIDPLCTIPGGPSTGTIAGKILNF